jgi:hypothetical protein
VITWLLLIGWWGWGRVPIKRMNEWGWDG